MKKNYVPDINAGEFLPQQDKFLIQVHGDPGIPFPRLNEFANAGFEAILFQLWKDPNYYPKVTATTLEGLERLDCTKWQCCIPIGTIEFAEKVMQKVYHVPRIEPVNIPLALQQKRFFKRNVAFASGADAVRMLFDDWGVDELFVKSAYRAKADFTGVYKKTDSSAPPLRIVLCHIFRTDEFHRHWSFHGTIKHSTGPFVLQKPFPSGLA